MKSQGEIEAAICTGVAHFEQEYMGRGPKDIHMQTSAHVLRSCCQRRIESWQLLSSQIRPRIQMLDAHRLQGSQWLWGRFTYQTLPTCYEQYN